MYRNSVCTSQEIYLISATDPTRPLRANNHTLPSHLRLCSLFVASYDSQGYGGGILTRLHTGYKCELHTCAIQVAPMNKELLHALLLFAEATMATISYTEHVTKLYPRARCRRLCTPPYFLLDVRDFGDERSGKWTGSVSQSHGHEGHMPCMGPTELCRLCASRAKLH
jgi:hypothetical protein